MKKCPYNTTKKCDGLCNNCPKNIKTHENNYKIIPATNHWYFPDYEEAILARQESIDF